MKLSEFMEQFNMAPVEMEKVACAASVVEDRPELSRAALKLMKAQESFEAALKEIGFELG